MLKEIIDLLLKQDTFDLIIFLICLLIGIIVSFSLIKTFVHDIKRMRKRDTEDKIGRSVDMCGVYAFLFDFIYCVDTAILVYIAKSLCGGSGISATEEAFVIALPLSMYFTGAFLGGLFCAHMTMRLGEKHLSCLSCLAIIVSLFMMIIAIQINSIWLFILAKFIEGVFLGGFIAPLSDTLPFGAKNDQEKRDAVNAGIKGVSAAGVIAVLLSGYLSTIFSYQAIYILGIVVSVCLMILSLIIFESKSKKALHNHLDSYQKRSIKGCWRVFLKPPVVMLIIFLLLPKALIDGYKTYLFPMYTAGLGVSVMLLANVSVFSKTITYVLNGPLDRYIRKLNKNLALILPCLIFSIGEICFFIFPNIYWAMFMLFISDLTVRLTKVGTHIYMMDISSEYRVNNKAVQSNLRVVDTEMRAFQGPILSMFFPLGMNLACTVVGFINGVMVIIMSVYQKRRKKRIKMDGE